MGLSTNIGLRALLTSQSALDTIGHNVANATTEGYSRQRVLTSSARPVNLRGLQLGNGVDADVVIRSVDELLNSRIVGQSSSVARLESQLTGISSVEALLNEPGAGGVGTPLDNLLRRPTPLLRVRVEQSGAVLDLVDRCRASCRDHKVEGGEMRGVELVDVGGDGQLSKNQVLQVRACSRPRLLTTHTHGCGPWLCRMPAPHHCGLRTGTLLAGHCGLVGKLRVIYTLLCTCSKYS